MSKPNRPPLKKPRHAKRTIDSFFAGMSMTGALTKY